VNREETKKAIEVMQAFVDGAEIEAQYHGNSGWSIIDHYDPPWNWRDIKYRIKPQPREWWVCWDGNRLVANYARSFPCSEYCESSVDHWDHYIKVREVIE
jgi:hypothetical protein